MLKVQDLKKKKHLSESNNQDINVTNELEKPKITTKSHEEQRWETQFKVSAKNWSDEDEELLIPLWGSLNNCSKTAQKYQLFYLSTKDVTVTSKPDYTDQQEDNFRLQSVLLLAQNGSQLKVQMTAMFA